MTETPDHRSPQRPFSPYEVLVFLARSWAMIAVPAVLLAALLVGVALLRPRSYTATASFYPQRGETELGSVGALSQQLGLGLPLGNQGGPSLQFYAELLDSRELLLQAAETRYEPGDGGPAGTFIELMEIGGGTPSESEDAAVDALRGALDTRPDPATGIIEFAVTTPRSALSRDVTSRLLELLVEFNQQTRQSQARSEREFLEERLEAATGELHAAEDSLKTFYAQNIRFENSPELLVERDRLQRRVLAKQQVVTLLTESFEKARIEEVRNAGVITVVDPPRSRGTPDPRGLVSRFVVGILAGALVGTAMALWVDLARRSRRRNPEAYAEYLRLKRETLERLRTGDGRAEASTTPETATQQS